MAVLQTSLQDPNNIILESAKVEYSIDDGSNYVDLGLADNVVITFNSTPRDVQPGNGATPDIAKGSASQMGTVTADLWELSTQNYADISGGLFTRTTTAGTPIVDQNDIWAVNTTSVDTFYAFDVQSYDGSVPTNISIDDDTPSTYILDDAYRILQVGSRWGYMFISGGTPAYDPTAIITVEYDVTPSVAEKVTVGGSSSQTSIMVKVTNLIPRTDVSYDIQNEWNLYNCFIEGDLAIAMKNKDETDAVARVPITLKATLDDTRTVNDQLYSFERTQLAH